MSNSSTKHVIGAAQAGGGGADAGGFAGGKSLKHRVMAGGAWTAAAFAGNQALRLARNLVLTRLLFPEAFGLMAVATVVIQGLTMMSDVGIRDSIVQNKRGDERAFVNTAWTIQIVRGLCMTAIAMALAWPLAWIYQEPALFPILLAIALGPTLSGFQSTKEHTLSRQIRVARLSIMELSVAVIGTAVTILIAWWWRSVWALVIGGLIGRFVLAVATHVMLPGENNRLHWCADSARAIWRLGRWISISSFTGFLVNQGDRLLLGLFMSMNWLGVYSVAFFLSQAAPMGIQSLSGRIIMPAYAESYRQTPERFHQHVQRMRTRLLALVLPPLWLMVLFGDQLVRLLYDPRFAEAGWMLQVLTVGAAVHCVTMTVGPALLAMGDSFRRMIMITGRAVVLVVGIIVGGYYFGEVGVVVAVAVSAWCGHLLLLVMLRPYKLASWRLDGGAVAVTAAVAAAAYALA